MKISLIAALDRRLAIGREGTMPWHLPDDLRRFKALTLGKPVLMGRKTALAIGRALPGRDNLVLTRGDVAPYAGQRVVHSLVEAIDRARDAGELAVIGGGEVYALALPRATHLDLTWVDTEVAGIAADWRLGVRRAFRAAGWYVWRGSGAAGPADGGDLFHPVTDEHRLSGRHLRLRVRRRSAVLWRRGDCHAGRRRGRQGF